MDSNKNSFRNVIDITPEKEKHSGKFKKNVIVPFFSGVIGCAVVIGICFGVPSIKNKIIGSSSPSTSTITSNDKSAGTVDFVSLTKYSDTAVYASNKILPSIVGIKVTYNVTSQSMFGIFGEGRPSTSEAEASGSGIIISEDGYILTNNHVVDSSSESTYYDISEATSVKVTLYNSDKEYDAKIVGKDSQTDLAVLKIEGENLTAAEFANSDEVKVGEFAMAVGNPLNLGTTITCGVVSAVNREVNDSEDGSKFVCIQTDAAINSGNSGGALVNSQGQVIGVNTLKVSSTGVEGIGFAIPINSTVNVTDDLINYNKVRRPYIGIQGRNINEETAKKYELVEGVYIVSVEEYSAAEKAGLKSEDIIIAVNGEEVKTMDKLNEIKNKHSIGDKLKLKINRNGKEKEITITLGESK
ncbi:MAG: trypsin-like serine protease [Clostridia bacterium]|nr:trypsin-like serine protease [Clostridia bacterium]